MMSVVVASDTVVRRDFARLAALVDSERDLLCRLRDAAATADQGSDPIAAWLYRTWYSTPPEAVAPNRSTTLRPDLAAAFRASLAASRRWSTGWVVLEVGRHGACVAGRRGAARTVRAGEYLSLSRPGVPVAPGDAVALTDCVSWVDWPTGFWTTQSFEAPSSPFVRVYFSVDARDMPGVLASVTDALETLRLRYSLKCPVWPVGFSRVDTLVLYLETAAWQQASGAITTLAQDVEACLRPWCPPLTLRLARGVAFAEDPGGSESFGQCRCRMLADTVVAVARQPRGADQAIACFTEALSAAGLDPERPWLNGRG